MKHIRVPETVTVVPWVTNSEAEAKQLAEEIPFLKWATFMWLDDARAYLEATPQGQQQSVMRLRRWQKVIDRFEASRPGGWISLDDQDYATLRTIVEHPTRMLAQNNTRVALACLPYVDAVLDAVSDLPTAQTP